MDRRQYCGLCKIQLKDALQTCSLPCGHVFCRPCFSAYCESKQTGSVIKVAAVPCPNCRRLIDVKVLCSGPTSQLPSILRSSEDNNASPVSIDQSNYLRDSTNDSGFHDEFIEPPTPAAPITSDVHSVAFVFPEFNRMTSSCHCHVESVANDEINNNHIPGIEIVSSLL